MLNLLTGFDSLSCSYWKELIVRIQFAHINAVPWSSVQVQVRLIEQNDVLLKDLLTLLYQ